MVKVMEIGQTARGIRRAGVQDISKRAEHDLFGADLYCWKEPFGADLYAQRPLFSPEYYCDINSKIISR